MHFHTSYTTGPSFVLWKAPTGQTEAHAGFSQCMHRRRMNLSACVRTAVNLWAEGTSSAAIESLYGRLFCVAQACSHCLHPIQRVASYKSALPMNDLSPDGDPPPEILSTTPELIEESGGRLPA